MKRRILCLMIFLSLFPAKGICETREIIAEDVVEVVAKHAMRITVLDKKRSALGNLDAIKFQVKIKAVMTTEEVAANLKKAREDRGVIDAYNRLKADYDRQAGEMEAIRKRLTTAGGEEKKQVLADITNEEKLFKANLWLEKATEIGHGEMALKAYDKAIELNQALVEAYIGRAKLLGGNSVEACGMLLSKGPSECEGQQENLNKALSDLNKAISLDKGHAEAYVGRANVFTTASRTSIRRLPTHGKRELRRSDRSTRNMLHKYSKLSISLYPSSPTVRNIT